MVFDSILFDFDGVLADTEPVHFACWREVLAEFGIDLGWPYFERECIGVSDRGMLERLGALQSPPVSMEVLWPSYDRKKQLFQARLAADGSLFTADTVGLLHDLHGSHKLAVVSSSHRSEIVPSLDRAGILPLFDAVVCGLEAARLKPAPDPYLLAARLLGAARPLVVEDSDAGVESGHAAGFEVLRLSSATQLRSELTAYLSSNGLPPQT